MARKSIEELERLDFWSLPEFARLKLGASRSWVYDPCRFRVDAAGGSAWLRLPNGVEVEARRDHNGRWRVSRHQYETLMARAMEEAG